MAQRRFSAATRGWGGRVRSVHRAILDHKITSAMDVIFLTIRDFVESELRLTSIGEPIRKSIEDSANVERGSRLPTSQGN